MKSVLILSCNGLNRAPRVLKEINALKNKYQITFAGKLDTEAFDGCKLIPLKFSNPRYNKVINFHHKYPYYIKKFISFLIWIYLKITFHKFRTFESYSLDDYELLMKNNYDIIIIHYPELIKLGFKLKNKNTKIIFSAHEYYPEEFNNESFIRYTKPYYEYLCKKYLPKVDLIFSPSQSISDLYKKKYNKKSVVMFNTCEFKNLYPSPISEPPIKIIHHGICIPQRDTEFLLKVAYILGEKYELNLMLIDNHKEYFSHIVDKASLIKNVKILPPQPYNDLISFINQFDIFLIHLPPENLNHKFCLPNKLFEAIQARLCLVSTPLKDVADFILKHNIGKVSEYFTPESIAKVISGLSVEDILTYKKNSDYWSKIFCSENTQKYISECMDAVLTGNKLPSGIHYLQS
ncbi:MAG: hypothetical protein QXX91_03720 [Thermoplasmata archaeon]